LWFNQLNIYWCRPIRPPF